MKAERNRKRNNKKHVTLKSEDWRLWLILGE